MTPQARKKENKYKKDIDLFYKNVRYIALSYAKIRPRFSFIIDFYNLMKQEVEINGKITDNYLEYKSILLELIISNSNELKSIGKKTSFVVLFDDDLCDIFELGLKKIIELSHTSERINEQIQSIYTILYDGQIVLKGVKSPSREIYEGNIILKDVEEPLFDVMAKLSIANISSIEHIINELIRFLEFHGRVDLDLNSSKSRYSYDNVVDIFDHIQNRKEVARPTAPQPMPSGKIPAEPDTLPSPSASGALDTDQAQSLRFTFKGALNRAAMANALTEIMNRRDLSVRKTAVAAGVGTQVIQRIASGDATIDKSMEVLEKLGCGFRVTIESDEPTGFQPEM